MCVLKGVGFPRAAQSKTEGDQQGGKKPFERPCAPKRDSCYPDHEANGCVEKGGLKMGWLLLCFCALVLFLFFAVFFFGGVCSAVLFSYDGGAFAKRREKNGKHTRYWKPMRTLDSYLL